jgi:RimJ/RimL family protein N-acetyltransferase
MNMPVEFFEPCRASEDGRGADHYGTARRSEAIFPPKDDTVADEIGFRPWSDDDLETYVALLDDPDVWLWLPETYPDPLTDDLALDLIAISGLEMHHEVRAVLWRDQPVGQVRLQWDAPREPGAVPCSAEIGYWLGKPFWGQGIGRAMVQRAMSESFARHPHLESLWAQVHPENPASAKVLEAAGFVRDATAEHPADWIILRRERP